LRAPSYISLKGVWDWLWDMAARQQAVCQRIAEKKNRPPGSPGAGQEPRRVV
jgi:hypothetical protein